MKFGPVPAGEAAGAILAHSVRLDTRRLRKGTVLSKADAAALVAAGVAMVTVARLDPGDVGEDDAAALLAHALTPDDTAQALRLAAPFTGRANLFAAATGVLTVDSARVDALNAVDEAITLATLPAYSRVQARQMVATVKIIPYAVDRDMLTRAAAVLDGPPVLEINPVRVRRADLILTRTPGLSHKVVHKGEAVIAARLTALGITELRTEIVAHETAALAAALRRTQGEMTLILTGSATSDRQDTGPAGLVAAGGRLTRFGMPVDPGNLLFLGDLDGRPVIGLPGCARSPKLNGADWVIERVACGVEVGPGDIAAMGVGGLLKEIASRPEPRGGGARAPVRPRVVALLLAAGQSRRMEGRDKLLEPVSGGPLLRCSAAMLVASGVDTVLCVLPPGGQDRAGAVAGLDVGTIVNPRAAEGMGTSIAAGIAALERNTDAVLIAMADMPDLTPDDIDRLLAAFDPGENRAIVRACAEDGQPGHPVLFGRRFFEALQGLDGDRGAREIIADHADYLVDVPLAGQAAVTDLDTPDAWAAWRAAGRG